MIEMVEIRNSEQEGYVWIETTATHEEKIRAFIRENYGQIILEDYHIRHSSAFYIEIKFPAHAVGLGVLIRFIADLEFEEEEEP